MVRLTEIMKVRKVDGVVSGNYESAEKFIVRLAEIPKCGTAQMHFPNFR